MVNGIQQFEYPYFTPLDCCLWGWMKGYVYKREMDTTDELLARILDASACINRREGQLGRTKRDLRTRVAKCTEDNGDCGTFIANCDRYVISV